ncbi:MAG: hypothetical protein IJ008_04165, partial [Clostridia bacterium]|nr:hypothetical protein [Clostridia bacterium]
MKDLTLEDLEKMENMTIEEQLEYLDSINFSDEEDRQRDIEYTSQFVDDDGNFDHEAYWQDYLRRREEIDKENAAWKEFIDKFYKFKEEMNKKYPRSEGQTSITGLMRQ